MGGCVGPGGGLTWFTDKRNLGSEKPDWPEVQNEVAGGAFGAPLSVARRFAPRDAEERTIRWLSHAETFENATVVENATAVENEIAVENETAVEN